MSFIAVPEKPPLDWLYSDPENYVVGATMQVDRDGTLFGPDNVGRVIGIIVPKPGGKYIGGGSANGIPIPERYPDETFSDFHCGVMQFTDNDRSIVQRAVGSIAVEGGHSDQDPRWDELSQKSLKERMQGAIEWLQRRGPNAHLISELGVYGRMSRIQSGPAAGAIIFRGAAYPWLTHEQAIALGATTCSLEAWNHVDHENRRQAIGVARVHQSSYRNPVPAVLASLESPESAESYEEEIGHGLSIVRWVERHAADSITAPPDTRAMREPDVELETTAEPVMASIEQPEFDSLRSTVNDIEDRICSMEQRIASFLILQADPDELATPARVDAVAEAIPLLQQSVSDLRDEVARIAGTNTPAPTADTPNPLQT